MTDVINPQGNGMENERIPRPYTDFHNNKYNVVSVMGYLIGIEKFNFKDCDGFLLEVYEKLDKNKNARIIRNLCRIRTAFEKKFSAIQQEFNSGLKNIGSLPEYIPPDAVTQLAADGIQLYKSRPTINEYLLMINRELSNRVGQCKELFPEWLNWNYIKPLFLMPNGTKEEGLRPAWLAYSQNYESMPFGCYMNWPGSGRHILTNDFKFVTSLYEAHEDYFPDISLLRDVGDIAIDNIESFVANSSKVLVAVDCENSDPVKLAAALSSLPKSGISKISKVLLCNDEHTTSSWQVLQEVAPFPVDHIMVQRLVEHKSQVDMTLALETSKAIYKDGVDGVILVSSDSDYWALIQAFSDIAFLVMLEKDKTGKDIVNALDSRKIHYCYLDDFYTGASYSIKIIALTRYLQERLDGLLTLNLRALMNDAFYSTWVDMTEKEKEQFYKRYLEKAHLEIDKDGNVHLALGA